jgi:hypothetical protein
MVAGMSVSQSLEATNEACFCRSIVKAHQPLAERDSLSNLRHEYRIP